MCVCAGEHDAAAYIYILPEAAMCRPPWKGRQEAACAKSF